MFGARKTRELSSFEIGICQSHADEHRQIIQVQKQIKSNKSDDASWSRGLVHAVQGGEGLV